MHAISGFTMPDKSRALTRFSICHTISHHRGLGRVRDL
jgi:hypothetical protein